MANYLVTGGAGFIGSHLVEELVRRGERVRVVDNLVTGKRQNIAHVAPVEFIEGDLADLEVARRAVDGIDFVLHQAAIPSVPRSVQDPITSNRANIDASLNVLVAARDAGVKRLVYAGSSSAYGNTPTLPKVETMPTAPLSPYALQKLVAEQYCQMFTNLYGLETVTVRYFNVFGPRQDPSSPYSGVISLFISALAHYPISSIVGTLFIAAMLAHIYIGTIGMEGAFEGMGEGTVDVNWAREHHALWLEQENARTGPNDSQRQPMATPAE